MKSFIANMHMAKVKLKKKELLWKKYITDYELTTPTETVKLVKNHFVFWSHRICPAFLYFLL